MPFMKERKKLKVKGVIVIGDLVKQGLPVLPTWILFENVDLTSFKLVILS